MFNFYGFTVEYLLFFSLYANDKLFSFRESKNMCYQILSHIIPYNQSLNLIYVAMFLSLHDKELILNHYSNEIFLSLYPFLNLKLITTSISLFNNLKQKKMHVLLNQL